MLKAKECDDCGLPRTDSLQTWLDVPEKRCYAKYKTTKALLMCNKLTIARLRKQIAELNEEKVA